MIQRLVDVVSKNGNLMLNIPVRGDGTIDDKEERVIDEITEWMRSQRRGAVRIPAVAGVR